MGDSLLDHIAEPEGWVISNEAGATLSKTDHLMETQLYPDCLLIQLGTNDLVYNKLSATEIINKYTDIIANVKNRFRRIGVCSIPPGKKKGEDIKLCNDTAKAVNTYLETLTKVSPDQMIYIDTWAAFWSQRNGQAIAKLYVTNDHKGVNLNNSGKYLLMSVMVNKIRATSTKRKSSNNLSPVNKSSKESRIGSTDGLTSKQNQQNAETLTVTEQFDSIKCLLINVCGLKCKVLSSDFENYIANFDIIGLVETKLDCYDQIDIPGYSIITKNKKKNKLIRWRCIFNKEPDCT